MKEHKAFISVLVVYLFLFLPFLGSAHLFDWDEINFAEAAREMLVTGDWWNVKIGYEPFWEKPPFFIWMQAISMQLFGINSFAARLPNVLVGFITLIVLYSAVYKRYSKRAALYAVLLYLGSFTPHFYFKSGIIDPTFNLFIFLSVLQILAYIETKRSKHFFLTGLWLGAAIITKGPAALLIVGLVGLVYQVYYRHNFYTIKSLLVLLLGLVVFPLIYFGIQVNQSGWWFIQEFIVYQIDLFRYPIASHGQPFYYHFVVLLIGCFPLIIVALPHLFNSIRTSSDFTFTRLSKVLFWVVLVLFSLVTTKIVHYSSMCYLPLAAIGGVSLAKGASFSKLQKVLFVSVGLLWSIVFMAIGSFGLKGGGLRNWLLDNVADTFVQAQLATLASWSIAPVFIGIFYFGLIIYTLRNIDILKITSFLVTSMTLITVFLVSTIKPLEQSLQGMWIDKLATYQGKEMMHFTLGFKSYAHIFYTQQQDLEEVKEIRLNTLKAIAKSSYFEMSQFEKQEYDVRLRDFIIRETTLPVSVSVKIDKFDRMVAYPELIQVFKGNGYGIWERKNSTIEAVATN